MPDLGILGALLAVGAVTYAMRGGGFLLAGTLPQQGLLPRLLRLAPGFLFIAFAAAGIFVRGWPSLAGFLGALAASADTITEWATLEAVFAAAALAAALP